MKNHENQLIPVFRNKKRIATINATKLSKTRPSTDTKKRTSVLEKTLETDEDSDDCFIVQSLFASRSARQMWNFSPFSTGAGHLSKSRLFRS